MRQGERNWGASARYLGATGCETGQMSHVMQAAGLHNLPPARDFLVSPGFAGVAGLGKLQMDFSRVCLGSRGNQISRACSEK